MTTTAMTTTSREERGEESRDSEMPRGVAPLLISETDDYILRSDNVTITQRCNAYKKKLFQLIREIKFHGYNTRMAHAERSLRRNGNDYALRASHADAKISKKKTRTMRNGDKRNIVISFDAIFIARRKRSVDRCRRYVVSTYSGPRSWNALAR